MAKKFTFAERIRQDLLLLTINENFLTDVQTLRNKHGYPKDFKSEDEWYEYSESPEYENLNRDEDELAKKYFIPESHLFEFERFVRNGNFSSEYSEMYRFMHLNPGCVVDSGRDEDGIFLKIYPDTTLDDIREKWPTIKYHRDKILNRKIERKVRIENLERDLEILRLKRAGKTGMEIRDMIKQDERFKDQGIEYEEVPKLITRLKEMGEKYKFKERIKLKKIGKASKKS
jgi:hypothetical protein